MAHEFPEPFAQHYDCLLKRLKLHGMQPKTIALYSHGVRRAGVYFSYQIDALSRAQLTDYFVHVLEQLSWSTLKHNLYGLKFYYAHVLQKPWPGADLVTDDQETCGVVRLVFDVRSKRLEPINFGRRAAGDRDRKSTRLNSSHQ